MLMLPYQLNGQQRLTESPNSAGELTYIAATINDSATPQDEIDRLIKQLGDDEYTVREKARQQLQEIGAPAVDALRKALRAPDEEIRFQVRRLLRLIELSDYSNRIEKFLASADPANSFGLPGWKKFSAILGTDKTSRTLFVHYQKRYPDSMKALEGSDNDIDKQLNIVASSEIDLKSSARRYEDENVIRAIICSLVLVLAKKNNSSSSMNESRIANWLADVRFKNIFENKKYHGPLDICVRKWMAKEVNYNTITGRRLNIAINLGMTKEGIEIAKKFVEGTSSSSHYTSQAILFLGKYGNAKDHLKIIEKHLNSTGQAHAAFDPKTRAQIRVNLGDVALAVALQMTNQKPADFGFKPLPEVNYAGPSMYPRWFFKTKKDREKAMKKWTERRKLEKADIIP
jgi:hypothetical protein